jgi:hypothetical protein
VIGDICLESIAGHTEVKPRLQRGDGGVEHGHEGSRRVIRRDEIPHYPGTTAKAVALLVADYLIVVDPNDRNNRKIWR